MSRRQEELIYVATYADRLSAEAAWESLLAADLPCAVITDDPPWSLPQHRIQVARKDAAAALAVLRAAESRD